MKYLYTALALALAALLGGLTAIILAYRQFITRYILGQIARPPRSRRDTVV